MGNGEGRIRTDGELASTLVFKTRAINHSTTSPRGSYPKDRLVNDTNCSLSLNDESYSSVQQLQFNKLSTKRPRMNPLSKLQQYFNYHFIRATWLQYEISLPLRVTFKQRDGNSK